MTMDKMKLTRPITVCLECRTVTQTGGGLESCLCADGIWVMPEGEIPDKWRTVHCVTDPVLPGVEE